MTATRRVAAVLALAAILVFAVVLLARGAASSPAGADAGAGLQGGPAPWPPETRLLHRRLAGLHLPGQSDTAFHIHALLRIYVDGRPVPVPAFVGIDPDGRSLASLHTHDATGIVHVEADRPYPFTLGQFFAVWGVRFGADRIGGYVDRGSERLRVYADGVRVADPAAHVLHAHDRIVVVYGRAGSAPTTDATPFPPGL